MSSASILACGIITTAALIWAAFTFDPTKIKTRSKKDGRMLNLPPQVPLKFIFPRLADPLQLFAEIREKYGPLSLLHIPFRGTMAIFLGSEPAKYYLFQNDRILAFDTGAIFGEWSPIHALVAKNEMASNANLKNVLNRDRLPDFKKHGAEVLHEFWTRDQPTTSNLFDFGMEFILQLNCRVVFGAKFKGKLYEEFKELFLLGAEIGTWISNPIYLLIPSLGRSTRKKAGAKLYEMTKSYLEQQFATTDAESYTKSGYPVPLMFHAQQEATDPATGEVNLNKVLMICLTVLNAAHTNSGSGFAWLLFYTFGSKYPDLKERLRSELKGAVQDGVDVDTGFKNSELDFVKLATKTPYFESVVREIVRRHISGTSVRISASDLEFGGFEIPEGTLTILPHAPIHKNPLSWVEPDVLQPERHLAPSPQNPSELVMDLTSIQRGKNLTFGAGRHPCTGFKYVMLELKVMMALIFEHYDITVLNEDFEINKQQANSIQRPKNPVLIKTVPM